MNHVYQRNPARLVVKLDFAAPSLAGMPQGVFGRLPTDETFRGEAPLLSRARERDFMDVLHRQEAEAFQPLIVVMGGFMDGSLGHAYAICAWCPATLRATHDVYYREHAEGADVRELVELYRHRGKNVMLLGHSWGGDAAVYEVARKTRATIHLLVTLDPVSRKQAPKERPVNVLRWINVYVDYRTASWKKQSNLVARIGGPWQRVEAAHENIVCGPDLHHALAWPMFQQYVLACGHLPASVTG